MIFIDSRLLAVPPTAALGDVFSISDASWCANLHFVRTSAGACESCVYSGVSTDTSTCPGFFVLPHSPARPRIAAANSQRMRGIVADPSAAPKRMAFLRPAVTRGAAAGVARG